MKSLSLRQAYSTSSQFFFLGVLLCPNSTIELYSCYCNCNSHVFIIKITSPTFQPIPVRLGFFKLHSFSAVLTTPPVCFDPSEVVHCSKYSFHIVCSMVEKSRFQLDPLSGKVQAEDPVFLFIPSCIVECVLFSLLDRILVQVWTCVGFW